MSDQGLPGGGYRLGVSFDGHRVAGALTHVRAGVVAAVEQPVGGESGAGAALNAALGPLLTRTASIGVAVQHIDQVMFAVTEAEGLAGFPDADTASCQGRPGERGPVAVVRLGAATTAVPPLALWTDDFRRRISLAEVCLAGGAMLDGTEFEPLDRAGLVAFARRIAGRVAAVAITGVFSCVTPKHELDAAEVLRDELSGSIPILLSHEFGGLGLLERENATVLQAALTGPVRAEAARLQATLAEHGLGHAEVFFARNDGTIGTLDYAATHPLLLHGGADAAAARGVAALSGDRDALVALSNPDGTPRAVCALAAGSPRLTSGHTHIAGVPTGLRVIALIPVDAAAGVSDETGNVATGRSKPARDHLVGQLSEALDRAKDAPGDLPLLLAGPGAQALAAALPRRLPGTVLVRCPPGAEAASAVGVAVAPVSGEAARIVTLSAQNMDRVRDTVREAAKAAAVRAGAAPVQVAVTAVEEYPLAYLAEPAVMLRIRAEGPPCMGRVPTRGTALVGDTGRVTGGNGPQNSPASASLAGAKGHDADVGR